MAGPERLGQTRSGLYRSTPCQNIAATADDSSWQSPILQSLKPVCNVPIGDDRNAVKCDFNKQNSPRNDESSEEMADIIPKLSENYQLLKEKLRVSPLVNSRSCSFFDEKSAVEANTFAQPKRGVGVVASKSASSFQDKAFCHNRNSFNRNNFDPQKIDEEESVVKIESSFKRQTSEDDYSPITFSTPSAPGSARRSTIPVPTHRRTSSASSDDNSSPLNFTSFTANNVGLNKHTVTPSSGQRASSNLASQQKNSVAAAANGFKQITGSAFRQLFEGTGKFSASSGGRTPSNAKQMFQRSQTTPNQLVNGNFEGLHRSSTLIPTNNKLSGVVSSNTTSFDRRRPSKLPSKTMSQPVSRSTSPSGKLAHLAFRESRALSSRPTSARTGAEATLHLRVSRIPRSQGHSREASRNASRDGSPSRSSISSDRYSQALLSPRFFPLGSYSTGYPSKASLLSSNLLQTGTEMEQTLSDALAGTISLQGEEVVSETSSISSDILHVHSNSALNTSEIIALMASSSCSDRRRGLAHLQQMMRSNDYLSTLELKRVTEIFTRMFHDPKSKVFSAFLDTLFDVLEVHAEDLNDWLYTCLSRLFIKLASDLLASVQARIQKALQAVCVGFPFESQLTSIAKFLAEQSLASNLRVRLALLDHLHELTLLAEPHEFFASESCRQVALCVIQWTNEPKSFDIRKAAQNVVVALFNLNTPEFSTVLSRLPRSIQDCATRILHNHMYSVSQQMEPVVDTKLTLTADSASQHNANQEDAMSSEDYFSSLKKTAEDIQSLSFLT